MKYYIRGIFALLAVHFYCAQTMADSRVQLAVTHQFTKSVIDGAVMIEPESSIIDVLKSRAQVDTSFGNAFVTKISGYPTDDYRGNGYWFYYVNGLLADTAANAITVSAGDSIWWDFHPYSDRLIISSVIGSYPEPFRSGGLMRNLPTRLFCAEELCSEVSKLADSLRQKGVGKVNQYRLSAQSQIEDDGLNIIIGQWNDIMIHNRTRDIRDHALQLGLLVGVTKDGQVSALNYDGNIQETWPNAGWIAATGTPVGGPPVWIISGNDTPWTKRALMTLIEKPETIVNKSQIAITDGGIKSLPLPIVDVGR